MPAAFLGGHLHAETTPYPAMALDLSILNRHALVAGATGTGKTISAKVLAEQCSKAGVPVLMTDIKGDLSGTGAAGAPHPKITERLAKLGLTDFSFTAMPMVAWDVFGTKGHPFRTTVSEVGPNLLSLLMDLNSTQHSVLLALFKLADDNGFLLLNWDDFKTLIEFAIEGDDELLAEYGNLPKNTLQAIQRRMIALEADGVPQLFGEPAIDLFDLMQRGANGYGTINMLDATELFNRPRLYAALMLWLLAELYETLPEVGDLEAPRMVVMVDEAHLLFADLPKDLTEEVVRIVRLIRSKGVGLVFISQNPSDIPQKVLGQLGSRIQHALRVTTERDQDALNALVKGMPMHPDLDLRQTIPQLGVGEALVSVLDADGRPTLPQPTLMAPPQSRMGPLTDPERQKMVQSSRLFGQYERDIDRESAHERLEKRMADARAEQADEVADKQAAKEAKKQPGRKSTRQTPMEAMIKSMVRSIGSQVGRQLMRGVMGALKP